MISINEISRLLMKNNQLYFALIARELGKYGITIPQAFVLGEIREKPKTIGELSKALELSNSTISGIVDRLERNNIVVRVRDNVDRRVVFVSLSSDIYELEKQYPILKEGYFTQFFVELNNEAKGEQLEQIYSSLQVIQSLLEKQMDKQ